MEMKIGHKPFIIAEVSGNHGGDRHKAWDFIRIAKECGCDAVKFQLYEPEDLCDPANNELYEKCKTSRKWWPELLYKAVRMEIPIFASVFAPWAVEFLEKYDCPAYKLASPESTRLPDYGSLVAAIKNTGKIFIASSGMIDRWVVRDFDPHYLLYCKAGYPASIDRDDFDYLPFFDGFSDHTAGIIDACAMIKFGAKVIEKHFKLDDDCVDAAFSLNPQQMKLLCDIAHS